MDHSLGWTAVEAVEINQVIDFNPYGWNAVEMISTALQPLQPHISTVALTSLRADRPYPPPPFFP